MTTGALLSPAAIDWLRTLLQLRLSPALLLEPAKSGRLALHVEGSAARIQFGEPNAAFLAAGTRLPCAWWDAAGEGWQAPLSMRLPLPAARSVSLPLIDRTSAGMELRFDLAGMIYWALTRLEEIGRTDVDVHGRFPASASHAFAFGYLDRPIVDEWLHILRQVVERVWPQLRLSAPTFDLMLSHDVDIPSRYAHRPRRAFLRAIAQDVFLRRNYSDALRAPWIRLTSKNRIHTADPANTFDWIMNVSERHGVRSTFYFISGRTAPHYDAGYEIGAPPIRTLIREIHRRGHEIGLHPSYQAYRDPQVISREAASLRRICEEEGIFQREWGARMHFLRWEMPTTLYGLAAAGASHDATLGYADHAGFRCGTCFSYPAFDPIEQQTIGIQVRPLVAMECSVMDYMGLGSGQAARDVLLRLKESCRSVGGTFSLLWHNSELDLQKFRELYEDVVSG